MKLGLALAALIVAGCTTTKKVYTTAYDDGFRDGYNKRTMESAKSVLEANKRAERCKLAPSANPPDPKIPMGKCLCDCESKISR